jgi:hypothetical protein
MLRVITLNKKINALIGIEVVKGFRLGEVSLAGKSSYTEDVIVYPAPVYIPHASLRSASVRKWLYNAARAACA